MSRSIQTRRNLPDGANRLRIGMIMLCGVVASQTMVSMATGAGPLPRLSAVFSTQQVHSQIDARPSTITVHSR
jgi:hypothetical protein